MARRIGVWHRAWAARERPPAGRQGWIPGLPALNMVAMSTGPSMAQEIKAAKRTVEWFAEIIRSLIGTEEDDEIRSLRDQVGGSIEEWSEIAEQSRRQTGRLLLKMEQLEAELGYTERRPPAKRRRRGECSIELVAAEAGPCIRCCGDVGTGLVGWRWEARTGPLCDACLADVDVDVATALAMVQRLRELAGGGSRPEIEEMLELARAYAAATAGAWPLRSMDAGHLLDGLVAHTEEELGAFWLGDPDSGGPEEPN